LADQLRDAEMTRRRLIPTRSKLSAIESETASTAFDKAKEYLHGVEPK
jgi:hypothetical protein